MAPFYCITISDRLSLFYMQSSLYILFNSILY